MAWNWRNPLSFLNRSTSSVEVINTRRNFGGRSGILVSEDVAMKVAAYYRGIIYISSQIAKLPWEVKDKNNVVQEGSLTNLLSLAPNPEMNAMTFRLWAVQQAIHYGNSFSEIQRDGYGRPVAIWPINTRDVDLVRSTSGALFYRVTGNSVADQATAYLRPEDVFHVPNFHKTSDGLMGQGLIAYGSEALGIAASADRMAGGLFSNSGFPSGVITVEGTLHDDAAKRLKDSWDSSNQGRKSGGTRVLEQGAKYTPVEVDSEMLQFLDSRKFGVLEMARFFGLPPSKLFDNQSATFSNIENANLEVVIDTLDTWACNLEMEADVKILTNRFGGKYSELDLLSVFRGDMNARSNYFSKMMQTGSITPNEIRRKEGMSPYKDGDRFFIATNNYTPADRLDEVVDAQVRVNEPVAPAEPEEPKETESDKELKVAAARFLLK